MRMIVPSTSGSAIRSQKLGRSRDGQATIGNPQRCCIARFSAHGRRARGVAQLASSAKACMAGTDARRLISMEQLSEDAMPLATRLTKTLGIRHPVLLAPMGSIAGGRLAAAVTAAGGLGLIGGGYGDGEWLEREFAAAGNHRVGCGFI